MAAHGYPMSPRKGDAISGLPADSPDGMVFHAGTAEQGGQIVTSGGRVLCVTALADSVKLSPTPCWRRIQKLEASGVIRRRVDVRWRLSEEDFIRMPAQQLALLRRCAGLLKPGGTLVVRRRTHVDLLADDFSHGLADDRGDRDTGRGHHEPSRLRQNLHPLGEPPVQLAIDHLREFRKRLHRGIVRRREPAADVDQAHPEFLLVLGEQRETGGPGLEDDLLHHEPAALDALDDVLGRTLGTGDHVHARFEAQGWHVQSVADVNDLPRLLHVMKQARGTITLSRL